MLNPVAQAELLPAKVVAPSEHRLDLAITRIDDLTARYPWAALTTKLGLVETLVTVSAR